MKTTVLQARISVALFTLLLLSRSVAAQNAPGSPYSYFALGDLVSKGFSAQQVTSGTGIADRDAFTLNQLNPASYSSIRFPTSFIGETGVSLASSNSSSDNLHSDLSFPFLAIGFRTGQKSGMSVGMRQYSKVSYNISGYTIASGLGGQFNVSNAGKSGLSEIYLGYGLQILPQLSLGGHLSWIFGQINHTQTMQTSSTGSLTLFNENFMNTAHTDFGLQYQFKAGQSSILLGLTFEPRTRLNQTRTLWIVSSTDTLSSSALPETNLGLAEKWGVGSSIHFRNAWKVSADIQYARWSRIDYTQNEVSLNDSYRLAIGGKHLPDFNDNTLMDRLGIGGGVFWEKTYLNIGGSPVYSYGFTAGIEIPIRSGGMLRIIYENGTETSLPERHLTDRYSRLTIGCSLLEGWFQKVRIQ